VHRFGKLLKTFLETFWREEKLGRNILPHYKNFAPDSWACGGGVRAKKEGTACRAPTGK
jgi:hypothetical protein